MKSKTFPLFALTIFSLMIFSGLANAVTITGWNFESSTLTPSAGTGVLTISDTRTAGFPAGNVPSAVASMSTTGWNIADRFIELDLSTVGFQNIILRLDHQASATGPIQFKLQYSSDGITFTDLPASLTSTVSAFTLNPMNTFNFSTITSINNNANTKFRIVVPVTGIGTDPAGTLRLDNILIEGTAITTIPTSNIPEEIQECSLTGTHGNDLEIEIDDIEVSDGFGNDLEWLPMDEIEFDVKIDNNGNERIRNIEVKWGLYDESRDRWYIDEKENDFNLGDGDDMTLTINFKLDNDLDELDGGNYKFYVWANGEINDDNRTELCASDVEEIDTIIESDFVILDNIQIPDTAQCGSEIELTADVWNIGDNDQESVYVLINSRDLGVINRKVNIGDIDAFDSARLSTIIKIPQNLEEGKFYQIDMHVYNEDNEVYQNDFDDDDSKFQDAIKIQGGCGVIASVTLSANLQSGGKAGEQLVVKTSVTAEESGTYVLRVSGYNDWATLDANQIPVVLTAGIPKEVLLTFNVDKDASGSKTFNLEVLSGTDPVLTQPVSVSIEETKGFDFSGFGDNFYLWAIAGLNVLLVIIIIIVAIKVARK